MTLVAFDLDGTLSNPAIGIAASLNYALQALGAKEKDPEALTQYIGPPLPQIFSALLETDDDALIAQAIVHYRDRYSAIGYAENTLYDQIPEVLQTLNDAGIHLYVATAKRQDIARLVIAHFGLEQHFVDIFGCGKHQTKADLLQQILNPEKSVSPASTAQPLLMVGDRAYDMAAGREVGAHCVGVLWGFGSVAELTSAGAHSLIEKPHDVLRIINTVHNDSLTTTDP